MNDGDWICPDANCGNINFARRMACYRCNKDRPDAGKKDFKQKKLGTEIGKSAAEKSRGLFNADDWQCNKCTNVNWARRQTCNVCNAPKFGEVEARTGYGGGYNERGTVEYRRREQSSDDEYDEFGRKKKKRSSYTPAEEDVGVTAGTVHIKVPPTVLPNEKKMEYGLPQLPHAIKRKEIIQSGSLSDGSVCDVAPLTKTNLIEFRKQQFQIPYNVPKNENKLQESAQKRKRNFSGGDKDLTYSSGYETSYKKISRFNNMSGINTRPMYNPVMENSVSSTNDVGYACTKKLPIIYTLDERVQIAAAAVIYNNCKFVTQKFESFHKKPAPDYKTIFLWRQRLLTTGCLNDSHSDNRKDTEKSSSTSIECIDVTLKDKNILKKLLPNPDEIKLDSESESDLIEQVSQNNYHLKYSRRSSVETVILVDPPKNISPQKGSSETKPIQAKSIESVESDYPDTDSDPEKDNSGKYKQSLSQKSASARNSKPSQSDSETDTPSTGEQTDYFSNYGKPKRKLRRRITSARTISTSKTTTPAATTPVQKYSTVCPSEKSPLVTGNIYAPKLNMTPKKPKAYVEIDTCSTEYVPTKIGATTKQNYQQFKDNVIKRGYWAKGNGMALNKCTEYMKTNTHNSGNNFKKCFKSNVKPMITPPKVQNNVTNVLPATTEISLPPKNIENYTNSYINIPLPETNTLENASRIFDIIQTNSVSRIPLPKNKNFENSSQTCDQPQAKSINNIPLPETKKIENLSRIFDIVQTKPCKNQNITDIFNTNENVCESPPKENTLQAYDEIRQRNEKEWDEEDDALYRNDDDDQDDTFSNNKTHSQSLNKNIEPHTPTYQNLPPQKHPTIERSNVMNVVTERKNQLFNMLNDIEDDSEVKQDYFNKGVTVQNCQIFNTNYKDNNLFNMSKEKESTKTSTTNHFYKNEVNNVQTRNNYDEVHNLIIRPHNNSANESIQSAKNNTLRILSNIQIAPANNNIEMKKSNTLDLPQLSKDSTNVISDNNSIFQMPSKLLKKPKDIPDDISNQMIILSKSDEVPNSYAVPFASNTQIENQLDEPLHLNSSKTAEAQSNIQSLQTTQNLSALLTGIDANALMLALRNIQQLNPNTIQNGHTDTTNGDDKLSSKKIETINLTYDEEWEKDTDCEESIEQRLEKMDGNTGDTPFLGDIFDPGPVMIPHAKKLNLPIENPELNETDLGENGAVAVGSFKSFALPKPILLNRLKLRIPNTQEKNCVKKTLKKRIKKPKGEGNENEPGDDEESDDNADLSKYELWGSDEEKSNAPKVEDTEDNGQSSKAVAVDNDTENEKNGGSDEVDNKKRSRTSSSSSSSSSTSSSSPSSDEAPNKFDDFNLNSERESPNRAGRNKSRSRSPRPKPAAVARRKSRDSRSGGDSRGPEQQRDRQRRPVGERREHRYSRDGNNYYPRGKHR